MSYQAGGDDGKSEAQPAADSKEVQHEQQQLRGGRGCGHRGRAGASASPPVRAWARSRRRPALPARRSRRPSPPSSPSPSNKAHTRAIELSGKLEFDNISLMYVRQASPEGISGA